MTEFLQQLVNGLTLGSMYALVALGFTLIFGVLQVIAFAQGGVYMLGAYAGLLAAGVYSGNWVLSLGLAVIAGAATAGIGNVLVDRIAYRPIRGSKSRLTGMISGLGLYIFIENGAGLVFGVQPRSYQGVLPSEVMNIGGVRVSAAQLLVVSVTVVCVAILWFIVQRSAIGLTIRAVAEKPSTAGLMGVEPERVIITTFLIAGALSGVAGVLVGGYLGLIAPTMGFLVGLKAFAAAVIGGIGSIPGALAGGLAVGLIETFGAGYVSSAWADGFVFVALIAILLIKPNGFFGMKIPERA